MGKTAQAQDVHFSQIFETPLHYNPAATGKHNGEWRVMDTYRTQWSQIDNVNSFTSNALAFDKQFYNYTRKLSVGAMFLYDASGNVRLNSNKLYLSAAYHIPNKIHQLHFGYQLGFVYKSINLNEQTFPNQFDRITGMFNSELDNMETDLGENLFYIDMNVGFIYELKLKRMTPQIGLAMFHFNRPKDHFSGIKEKLPPRFQADIGVKLALSKFLALRPYALATYHAKASEALVGGDVFFLFSPSSSLKYFKVGGLIRAGLDRNTDAAIAKFGFNFKNFDVGFSYDMTISELQQWEGNANAMEFSLIYTQPSSRYLRAQEPCDRF